MPLQYPPKPLGADPPPSPPRFVHFPEPEKKQKKRRRKHGTSIGFEAGHHAVISGATKTGKTVYVVDAILGEGTHNDTNPPWDAIIVMCDSISCKQEQFARLQKKFDGPGGVTMLEGLPMKPDEEEKFMKTLEKFKEEGYRTLIVVDDLMNDTKTGPEERFVTKLFTSVRHMNADVWEINQTHTASRARRLNAGYLVFFSTPSDVASVAHIGRQMRPQNKGHDVVAAYKEATQGHGGHGCLVVVLNAPDEFKYRNTRLDTCFDMDKYGVTDEGLPKSDDWMT